MMSHIQWKRIGLAENPFAISPPDSPESAVWAGLESLKADFMSVLREAKSSAPTQVILCRGPVGSGKTHASLYFQNNERWPQQEPSVRDVYILRVPTPKETGKPDRDFYIDVMEHIGIEKVSQAVQQSVGEIEIASIIEEAKQDRAWNVLKNTMVSADLIRALLRLGQDPNNPLLKAYFLGKCTPSELRKLGLNRNIEKTQDYFRVLAGVFQCLIGFSDSRDPNNHARVCLWLDEMEDFVYFSPAQYRPFGQGIRELVDRVPFFFTLFLNFTLTSPEEYEEIELILGNYLIDRVTGTIFFEEISEAEMLKYVHELLNHYRTPTCNELVDLQTAPYFPFEEQALKLLLAPIHRRTPRDINKRCRSTLVKAFDAGLFRDEKLSLIDSNFVQNIAQEELYREIG